jgi:hypothetical protein
MWILAFLIIDDTHGMLSASGSIFHFLGQLVSLERVTRIHASNSECHLQGGPSAVYVGGWSHFFYTTLLVNIISCMQYDRE